MKRIIIAISMFIILLNGSMIWLNSPYGGCNIRDGLGNEMDLKPIVWNYHWLRYTKRKPNTLTASLWGFSKVFWRIYYKREVELNPKDSEGNPVFIDMGTMSGRCGHCGMEFPSGDRGIVYPDICPRCDNPPWKWIGDEN